MVLNYVWVAFFLIAFVVALVKLIFLGDTEVFTSMMNGTFDSAKTGFTVALGLTGALTMWMGILRVGQEAGAIRFLSRIVGPFFRKLFPEIPKGHEAHGHIILNFSANMLGIGNAATPLGLQAMKSMQDLNTDKETASNSMIMFLALNTAGFCLIPVSILALRASALSSDTSCVFVPIMIASYFASLGGLIAVAIKQKIKLLDKVLLSWLLGITALVGFMIWSFTHMTPERRTIVSNVESSFILFSVIIIFIAGGVVKKLNVFSTFIDGAKEGFSTAVKIIPYLVAMLLAIGVFRACGAMDYLVAGFDWCFHKMGVNTDFTPTLPVAFMKPLSGGGTQGLVADLINKDHFGPDSFVGKLSSVMYASGDTTFYIVALYFGSVGIKKTRYAIGAGLVADLCGIVAAILISYAFWH
ncbi:MAG TPA: nucleoside recognition domain-containing protein [Bacteroidia bacterium]|jgi:spore maturation protein SpmA|nr:nucleoside recognition domain-containing protein [Bacteroidia bacterium]